MIKPKDPASVAAHMAMQVAIREATERYKGVQATTRLRGTRFRFSVNPK